MHNYTSNAKHAVIHARLAISAEDSTNVDNVADGLNELLRDSVHSGFLADYCFDNSDNPAMPTASENPEEGELLEGLKTYLLILVNRESLDHVHVRVETTLDLASMSEDEVRNAVADVVMVEDDDDIEVIDLSRTDRVVL